MSTCGDSVTQNCTYIQNPGYSSAYTTSGACSYTVTPLSTSICQLRLDFGKFVTTVATTGKCTDSFQITSPTNTNALGLGGGLCGTLTNQHIYIESGRVSTSTTLAFTIATTTTGATFSIKVSQIECSSTMRAPTDCAQYFTGASGFIKSYNWDGSVNVAGTQFTHCFRRENGYCAIAYNEVNGQTIDTFQTDDTTGTNLGMLTNVVEGWVYIPNANLKNSLIYGTVFGSTNLNIASNPQQVIQYNGNFQISHVAPYPGGMSDNIGFYLQYHQLPCGSGNSAYSSLA